MKFRKTIAAEIQAQGTALHAGGTVRMALTPAPAGSGIAFQRTDLDGADVPALYDRVTQTKLGTMIADGAVSIGVIEHLMAAIAGAEIDDLLVTLDGPEPPILDGDALAYLMLIERAGVKDQPVPRRAIKVLKTVEVRQHDALVRLSPNERLHFAVEIAFASAAIGRQRFAFDFTPAAFRRDIAPARTFGFLKELDALNKMNLARGASLENTLAIDGDTIVNAPLLRFDDEFVRHKILDAIGDMALAGAPLIARFEGVRSGHAVNNALLRALFADAANYAWVALS
jgi:UDP-3-O-[3-hydroxymyristoyl] N-acetylglucosamine deacetylase